MATSKAQNPQIGLEGMTSPIRQVIFLGLISFVFEHEIYHLREFNQVDRVIQTRRKIVIERFEALWRFIEKAFRDKPRVSFDKERCRRLLAR